MKDSEPLSEEPMTLWQIREQIAHDNGWANWDDMNLPRNTEGSLWALAAERYAAQFKRLDNIPEPDSQWISVKDRLPEYNTEVILIVEHWESKNRRTAICNRVNEDDCEWRTADDNSELSYSFNAIYWQPLPSPPVNPS